MHVTLLKVSIQSITLAPLNLATNLIFDALFVVNRGIIDFPGNCP